LHFLEEKRLLKEVKQKNRNAAEKLIDAHYLLVYKFHYRFCRHKQMAEDLTQETFIRVWQALANYNGKSRFSTWLYRISYHLYLDYKKQKRITTISTEKSEEKTYHIENSIEKRNQYQVALQSLNSMPEDLHNILILHYQQDLSFREIAQLLNIPKGTVKSRISNALKRLRKIMDENKTLRKTIGKTA
jgi:RNA polymerase sigma-70 factor (ECF subfamily)